MCIDCDLTLKIHSSKVSGTSVPSFRRPSAESYKGSTHLITDITILSLRILREFVFLYVPYIFQLKFGFPYFVFSMRL